MSWLRCQKIAGLKYWVQLLFNFTPVSVYAKCRPGLRSDEQERNLTFMKTDFQVLKLKFYACNFKQAFFLPHKLKVA